MRHLLFPVLLVCTQLPAQSSVSPAHFSAVEATGSSTLPFGTTVTPSRYQQIHEDVPNQVLHGLAFRHDTSGPVYLPFSLTLSAWVSTASVTSTTASPTFDTNHGPDKIQVVDNRTIAVPGNDPSQLPGQFLLDLPFDPGVTFSFAGGGLSLCWEVQVTARSNTTTNIPFDAVLTQGSTPTSPNLAGTRAFVGCIATGRTQPMAAAPANSNVDWLAGTGMQSVNATQLQSNGLFAWVGGTNTTQWAGLPLPAVLSTSPGAPSGPCTLHTDLALLTIGTAGSAGTAQLQLGFVPSPSLHGYHFYTQVLGLDPAANALGLTTSNLVVQQLVAPYPVATGIGRVYANGNLGPTGTVAQTSPLVTQFQ